MIRNLTTLVGLAALMGADPDEFRDNYYRRLPTPKLSADKKPPAKPKKFKGSKAAKKASRRKRP